MSKSASSYSTDRQAAKGKRNKLDVIYADKLPTVCYSINTMEPSKMIIIKRGELGFYHCTYDSTKENARSWADEMNRRLKVTKAQEEAMLIGSMFGWDCEGANPGTYEGMGEM